MRTRLTLAVTLLATASGAAPANTAAAVKIDVLPSRADPVSGGDTVVASTTTPARDARKLKVRVNRRDVSKWFARRADGRRVGLISHLRNGKNVIPALLPNGSGARLVITNRATSRRSTASSTSRRRNGALGTGDARFQRTAPWVVP